MTEFIFVLFVCPIVVLLASIVGYVLTKKWYVMPILTLVVFFILTFTLFNITFLIWLILYTLLSLLVSGIMKGIMK